MEINDKVPAYMPGALPHVTNLSLLRHTHEDIGFITSMPGSDPAVILSRGHGNCRITITATGSVWWVQYFNSQETLVADTVGVGGVADGDLGLMMQPDYPTAESLSEALEAVFGRIQLERMPRTEGIGRYQMCSFFLPAVNLVNPAAAVATEADSVAAEQDGPCALQERMQHPVSRRDMLRGVFAGGRAQARVD